MERDALHSQIGRLSTICANSFRVNAIEIPRVLCVWLSKLSLNCIQKYTKGQAHPEEEQAGKICSLAIKTYFDNIVTKASCIGVERNKPVEWTREPRIISTQVWVLDIWKRQHYRSGEKKCSIICNRSCWDNCIHVEKYENWSYFISYTKNNSKWINSFHMILKGIF